MNQITVPSRRRLLDDARQGLGSTRGPHISIKGGRFRLIAATEQLVDTHYLDMIVVDVNSKSARLFFGRPFGEDPDLPPKCFSDNGIGPSRDAMEPQAPTCLSCPQNRRGTAVTFNGFPTTACENRKKLACILPDDEGVTIYEFQVTPGSLGNFKAYTDWLDQQKHPIEKRQCDIADVVTRVSFDPNKQFTMLFTCSAWADDAATLQKIEHIFTNDLGAITCGRTDVAIDAATFGQLPRPEPVQQIAAPMPQAAPQLPPRTQQSGPSQALPAPAAPSRGRGRPRNPQPGAPTPFMAPAATAGQTAAAPSPAPQSAPSEIPDFLKRAPDNSAPQAPAAAPRFGIGQAPTPPAEIMNAVNQAMQLPSRR